MLSGRSASSPLKPRSEAISLSRQRVSSDPPVQPTRRKSMPFAYTTFKQHASRSTKPVLLALALSLIGAGALLAAVATKKFQVPRSVDITLCQADGQGGWKVIDTLHGSASFDATVNELASGNEYTTHQPWIARSEKGCQVSGRTT